MLRIHTRCVKRNPQLPGQIRRKLPIPIRIRPAQSMMQMRRMQHHAEL